MTPRELTPLGQVLDDARERLGLSGRQAAQRAGISEARWRQVVTGRQSKGGGRVAVNPGTLTIVAMALAVDADPGHALAVAGKSVAPEQVALLVQQVQEREVAAGEASVDVAAELDRIKNLSGISARDKLRMVRAVLEIQEQAEEDQEAQRTG
ncbi:helix-turn-helix transcriptional regulator [Solwaraspora sp. WMMD1047]|uniref:helix-turn-helix domain-containing protein n=1 Tax=Solwaraspora sp. WMMD1047 TaxID=3016102 RepID=UPI002417AB8C|nr:helix-turn-helix transcriptional regulator [Solwaraspora sp. WMMD1047]MDG4832382.1 helix-turn-helix transcriptional regulator [Solwaraspora sp. WMMD1047]